MSAPRDLGIRSMTGHGLGEATLGQGRVLLEVRAVNHRYLDVRVRLPLELAEHAGVVEERVRRALKRGRVEVMGRLDGEVCNAPVLDKARARAAFAQLSELRDELRPEEPVPLSLLACLPDLFGARSVCDQAEARDALERASDLACEAVWKMRAREGEALAEDLRGHLAMLGAALASVRERSPGVVDSYRERLRQRIERLLADNDVQLDPGRLEHEVALFADRGDIAEEIARLHSHCHQLRELLEDGEDNAGKRLDFLLQEMTREANTIGAKSSDAELARLVVEMKTAISRMREQAQNVL
jgi:uncharacterized protein (TIGR00255 family)